MKRKFPRGLPQQKPPIRIEEQFAKALVRALIPALKKAYADVLKKAPTLASSVRERRDFDPGEARDENGRWSNGGGDVLAAAKAESQLYRRSLGTDAPVWWNRPEPDFMQHLTPDKVESLRKKTEEFAQKRRDPTFQGYEGFGDEERAAEDDYRRAKARFELPFGTFPLSYDNLDGMSRAGHLYRGMTDTEYVATVGAGRGVNSKNIYSAAIEGTNFGYEAATASSYVNAGGSRPYPGKDAYIVEVRANPHLTYNRVAGYPQTPVGEGLPHDFITRVWKETAPEKGGDITLHEIPVPPAARTDSPESHDLSTLLAKAAGDMKSRLSKPQLVGLGLKFGQQVATHQRVQLQNQVRDVLGVDVPERDPDVALHIGAFARKNADLIVRIPSDFHDDIAEMTRDAVSKGRLGDSLRKDIQAQFGIAERHARLIARDQTSKLYANINHHRQRKLGISRGIWRNVGDERVRGNPDGKYPNADPSHWDLEGTIIDQEDEDTWPEVMPGEIGLPGSAILCRCYLEPILDDLLGDDDDDDEDEGDEDVGEDVIPEEEEELEGSEGGEEEEEDPEDWDDPGEDIDDPE